MKTLIVLALLALCAAAAQGGSRPASTLREAIGSRMSLGVAVAAHLLENEEYASLVARHFNSVTAENVMKPASMLTAPGQYNFTEADQLMAFAEANNMEVVGHTLIWHSQSPGFLFQDADGKPLSREQGLKNMRDHIFTVMGRYKKRIKGWDVVNEAVADSGGLRDTPALRSIGEDYLVKAFEFAAEADPEAELYYNDYNIELNYKRPSALKLVKSLREAGVRLDAVGIQGHYLLGSPMDEIRGGIREYLREGFKVHITELDVDPLPRQGQGGADVTASERTGMNPYTEGLPADKQEELAAKYGELFDFFLSEPGVERVTLWGATDASSWLNNFPVRGRTNHPLLFDRQSQPKPAFQRVMESITRVVKPFVPPFAGRPAQSWSSPQ
jgi:endo-1,4-beta-xylanase